MHTLSRLVRRGRLAAAVLLVVCAALFLPGLGTALVTRQQELRVLLAARTMADGGSWLIPQFMGEERLRKPPLMYWLVATAFETAGSTRSIAAARLVSTTCAIALVLATFLCGRRLVGRQTAFLGALVLATSLGFLRHARLAETDIPQAAFCSLALFMVHAALTDPRGRFRPWALAGICAGIGFMIKGPASLAMPLAAGVTFLLARRCRPVLTAPPVPARRWLGLLLAAGLFTAIAAPWYLAVAQQTASTTAQAGDELGRLLLESRHPGPFVYYLYTLPARLGLWALLLPVAVWGVARRWWPHRGPRFVLGWLASSFLILSALKSKQEHYALLLFVPSALVCGWLLRQAFRRSRGFFPRFARAHLAVLCLLPFAAALASLASRLFPLPAAWIPLRDASMQLVLCCGLLGLAGWWWRRNPLAGLGAIAVSLALAMAAQTLRLERLQTGYAVVPDLFDAHRSELKAAPSVLVAGPREPVMEWYAGRPVRVVTTHAAAAWARAEAGDILIASDRRGRTNIAAQILAPALASTSRLDVTVTLFRKAAPPP